MLATRHISRKAQISEVRVIRAFCLFSAFVLSLGIAYGQEDAKSFDDASLTKQQAADILRLTGELSQGDDIPGRPFIEVLRLSTNKRQSPQIVAWRGTGGGMGNKDIWLFQQIGKHAVPILRDASGSMYLALKSVHHGMRDFITFWNLGGGTGANEVFQFDGKRYRSAYCYDTMALGTDTKPEKDGPHHPCNH